MADKVEKVVYTAEATSTGGRDGRSRTPDGLLDIQLAVPKEMGGGGGGVNPEQLFAAGYSACFLGALKYVAGQKKVQLPADAKIDARVGIGPIPNGFGIRVDMDIHLPGLDRQQAQELVQAAHVVCPYSNATRGNVDVGLNVV